MYHPYFRGRQFELIAVRESANLLKSAGFRPIIEPVRSDFGSLHKALDAIVAADGNAIVIINPQNGELSGGTTPLTSEPLSDFLNVQFPDSKNISIGILLKQEMNLKEITACYKEHEDRTPVLIHAGFSNAKDLVEELGEQTKEHRHVFDAPSCGKLYQRHFKDAFRILLKDGFKRRLNNKEYPRLEPFSDLHVTFPDEGMDGFGDFLIVGSDYSDAGTVPYTLAIHLTFIDPDQDNSMQIYHFKSKPHITQKDPGGKFAEALDDMMETLDSPDSNILETAAVKEFRELHAKKHFPGLGHIKKLSMTHHLETLANYFQTVG
jgi:hypothetical protein